MKSVDKSFLFIFAIVIVGSLFTYLLLDKMYATYDDMYVTVDYQ